MHAFPSRAESRCAEWLGHQPLHLPVLPTGGIASMNQRSICLRDHQSRSRHPQNNGSLVGLDIRIKSEACGAPTWPGLKMLDQQRAVYPRSTRQSALPAGSGGSAFHCSGSSTQDPSQGWGAHRLLSIPRVIKVGGKRSSLSREHSLVA